MIRRQVYGLCHPVPPNLNLYGPRNLHFWQIMQSTLRGSKTQDLLPQSMEADPRRRPEYQEISYLKLQNQACPCY